MSDATAREAMLNRFRYKSTPHPLMQYNTDAMADALVAAERERDAATDDAARFKDDYERACRTIALMHHAATGAEGPKRGVVEDVADMKQERDAAVARLVPFIRARDGCKKPCSAEGISDEHCGCIKEAREG